MLSISFLPWVLFLLALVLSVPVAAYVDASRRKKELAAMEQDQPVIADDEYSELEQQEEGVAVMEEGPAGGSDGNDIFGNDFGGDPGADQGIFDDDAFK